MRAVASVKVRRPERSVEQPRDVVSAPGAGPKLTLHHDLGALRELWTDFEDRADGTVFQSFEWLSAYQHFIGAPQNELPCIALLRAGDGKVLALLPLAIRRRSFARELTWLGEELGDYNAPLLASEFAAQAGADGFARLWRDVLAALASDPRCAYDVIRLTKMPAHLRAQDNPLVGLLPTEANPSGSYATPLADSWEAFYAAKRSGSTRSRDRSKRKRLAEQGEIAFATQEGSAAVSQALQTLMKQKAVVFAERGIRNIFDRPGYADFYRAVATDSRFRRIAHVSTLTVGGETTAVNLGLTLRGRYYYVLSSYTDGPLQRLGPGAIHLHELMRHAIGRGMNVFDFTIGDERYKRDWCDGVQPLYDHVSVATLRGALAAVPLQWSQRLKRAIKQNPALWNLFSKVRALAARGKKD